MNITIIKYNAGNIQSVLFALERIGVHAIVTDNAEEIHSADKVIFPGVGEASTAMNYLKQRKLDELIVYLKQPVLGICLGMQLLCKHSEENDTDCLGVFDDVTVKKIIPKDKTVKVPQIGWKNPQPLKGSYKVPQVGWNTIYDLRSDLFLQVQPDSYCYFVHGYYAAISEYSIATTDYIQPYSSALQKDNFYGVQFHPEKSADVGEQILKNFLSL
jgi:glutamine amidotransferase